MLGAQLGAAEYLRRAAEELLRVNPAELQDLADAIYACYLGNHTVFICGNGGSAANASHFCEDLGKSTIARERYDEPSQRRIRVLSLTDNTSYILAWANDEGYDRIFVEQLKNLAEPGDLLIAISGSGNSPNVLKAVEWANNHGLVTFGVTGYDGGRLKSLAQRCFHVRLNDMGLVESIHLVAFHWVLGELYRRISTVPSVSRTESACPASRLGGQPGYGAEGKVV